jgi:outer membrane cobalamin receptor
MKNYIKINSELLGIGIGFLNFYILFYSWNISWEISFAVAFASGFIASKFLDVYAGKMSEEDLDKEKAEEISNAINAFEKK